MPTMSKIVIYTTVFCPFCSRAKQLLKRKGVEFDEIDIMMDPGKRAEMMERAGGAYTVPQIFADDRHVGDCDGLERLERAGKLDAALGLA